MAYIMCCLIIKICIITQHTYGKINVLLAFLVTYCDGCPIRIGYTQHVTS